MYASLLNFHRPASIRSVAPGTFPALNIGNTPDSVEIQAFAPGVDPARIEVTLDRGVLTLAGERVIAPPEPGTRRVAHTQERSGGRFRRTVSLPDDIDASKVTARYADGVLHVSVGRKAAVRPQRITVS